MSAISERDVVQKFAQLSDFSQKEVLDYIDERIRDETSEKTPPQPGWGKKYFLQPYEEDFEPLEEFKEYM